MVRWSRDERTAYHEAGHAIAACALRRRLAKVVSIIPDHQDRSLGRCHFGSMGKFRPDVDVGRRTQKKLDREMVIDLAGIEAEKLATGRYPWRWVSQQDVGHAVDLAMYLYSDEETGPHWEKKQQEARALLERHWRAVEKVARRLIKVREIQWTEVRAIFDLTEHPPTANRELTVDSGDRKLSVDKLGSLKAQGHP